jgi:hypothetical protein
LLCRNWNIGSSQLLAAWTSKLARLVLETGSLAFKELCLMSMGGVEAELMRHEALDCCPRLLLPKVAAANKLWRQWLGIRNRLVVGHMVGT